MAKIRILGAQGQMIASEFTTSYHVVSSGTASHFAISSFTGDPGVLFRGYCYQYQIPILDPTDLVAYYLPHTSVGHLFDAGIVGAYRRCGVFVPGSGSLTTAPVVAYSILRRGVQGGAGPKVTIYDAAEVAKWDTNSISVVKTNFNLSTDVALESKFYSGISSADRFIIPDFGMPNVQPASGSVIYSRHPGLSFDGSFVIVTPMNFKIATLFPGTGWVPDKHFYAELAGISLTFIPDYQAPAGYSFESVVVI